MGNQCSNCPNTFDSENEKQNQQQLQLKNNNQVKVRKKLIFESLNQKNNIYQANNNPPQSKIYIKENLQINVLKVTRPVIKPTTSFLKVDEPSCSALQLSVKENRTNEHKSQLKDKEENYQLQNPESICLYKTAPNKYVQKSFCKDQAELNLRNTCPQNLKPAEIHNQVIDNEMALLNLESINILQSYKPIKK